MRRPQREAASGNCRRFPSRRCGAPVTPPRETANARASQHGASVAATRTIRGMVKSLAFFAYPADDVTSMRQWYEEHLGLRFGAPYLEDGLERYNEAVLGDACFSLMWTTWTDRPAGSASGAYFEVEDLDATVAALQAKGVNARDRFEGPVCRQASFSDLEGNKVTIHQVRREA